MNTFTDHLAKLSTSDIQQRIYRIYDHLYANARVRTPAGIGREVGKILHVAMYLEETRPRLIPELGSDPAFQFSSQEVRKLSSFEMSFCSQVAQKIQTDFREMNQVWNFYEPETVIDLDDNDIAYACSQLNFVLVSDKTRDVFGDALEVFRGQWAKRESGQFFTDQRVTSLALALLQFDPRQGDDLIDLTAGTGGFLLAGLNRIRFLLEQENGPDVEKRLIELAMQSLMGQEIDAQVAEIANATLAARLTKSHNPFVSIGDSLRQESLLASGRFAFDSHLCAATNPPFGTKITIKDSTVLSHFELAGLGKRVTARAPDILFLEQNIRMLRPGKGRLAIVAPYQILSGPQALFIREWLLKQARILAVVDLPAETFQPHTGTKGILLVIQRREAPLTDLSQVEYSDIFMSMPRWIGHDRRGNPVYRRKEDGTLTGEILSDFDEVEQAYNLYLQGGDPTEVHSCSFRINTQKIIADSERHMNALFHRPLIERINLYSNLASNTPMRYVQLKDIVKKVFYPTRFKRNYVDYYPEAVPFLGGSNISQIFVASDKWLRHDDPKLEELKVRAGWIVITRSGSTGIVSTVPQPWDGYAMSEHIIRIVPDPDKLAPEYLFAFLRTDYAQALMARGVFGSVIDEITPEFVSSIRIPIPESPTILQNIIDKGKRAQRGRDEAIVSLSEAVEELSFYLKN